MPYGPLAARCSRWSVPILACKRVLRAQSGRGGKGAHQQSTHDDVLDLGLVTPHDGVGAPDEVRLQGGAQRACGIAPDEHADGQDRLGGLNVNQVDAQVLDAVGEREQRCPEERVDILLGNGQVDTRVYGEEQVSEGGKVGQCVLVAQLEQRAGNLERGRRVLVRQASLFRRRLDRVGLGRGCDDAPLL